MDIGFNKPYFTGREFDYIKDAISRKHISGNGYYTQKCQTFFEERYGFKRCLLTTSCTDALEMAAILLNIKPGDEVIMPSFTFVSTANAFVLRGAAIKFVDSCSNHPGMDEELIEELVTPNTKAIVVVHFAGVACDMDKVMEIANNHNLFVIEDAAQAINSYYKDKPLGSIGHLATFSFHETKNISSGEGGMLVINDNQFAKRAEIIWEKGTNRAAFFRGEIDKYGWVDIGSSFLPTDLIAAVLWAQLEVIDVIQKRRIEIWQQYHAMLVDKLPGLIHGLQHIPTFATNNAHMFYLVFNSQKQRSKIISGLQDEGISAVFHYQSLHKSDYFSKEYKGESLPNCDRYSECLMRLPFYYELEETEINKIVKQLLELI